MWLETAFDPKNAVLFVLRPSIMLGSAANFTPLLKANASLMVNSTDNVSVVRDILANSFTCFPFCLINHSFRYDDCLYEWQIILVKEKTPSNLEGAFLFIYLTSSLRLSFPLRPAKPNRPIRPSHPQSIPLSSAAVVA